MNGSPAHVGPLVLRLPQEVGAYLNRAQSELRRSAPELAVNWLAAAAVADIQRHQLAFLATSVGAAYFADQYAACFAAVGIDQCRSCTPSEDRTGARQARILYIIPSIVEGQAASNRLARTIEAHDRSRFDPHILCTEEMTERSPVIDRPRWPHAPSTAVGGAALARMCAAGVRPAFLETKGSYMDAARAAIDWARMLAPDIAVFIASPACPIQAALAWARIAPQQLNQNIGAPLIVAGIDSVIYHNEAAARADRAELQRRGIGQHTVPSVGTDIAAADHATPLTRAELGIDEAAVVFCTASNKLPVRMLHGTFGADLAAFLAANPDAWWVGIGRGDFTAVLRIMEEHGVADRVRLTGPLSDIRPALKACDIYVNEYPEGGCNTVLEAMACGLPVIAMDGGAAHTENIGAQLVGPGHAIGRGDTAAYWSLAACWSADRAERSRAGKQLRRRAADHYSTNELTRRYEEIYDSAIAASATAA